MPWGGTRVRREVGLAAAIAMLACTGVETRGADCNGNGVEDAVDVAPDRMGFVLSRRYVLQDVGPPVAAADFDGDEVADVAAGDGTPQGNVRVCRNAARGPEGECAIFSTGALVSAITPGDIDGDGDSDLFVVSRFFGSVFLNEGDGTFKPGSTVVLGSLPVLAALGDLNADGRLDAVVENSIGSGGIVSLSVMLNAGAGTFLPPRNFASGPPSLSIVAADFDGDRDADVSLQAMDFDSGARRDHSHLLRSDDAGVLSSWTNLLLAPSDHFPVLVGDLDGNGDADWVANTSLPEVAMYLGDGRGGAAPRRAVPRDSEREGYSEALLALHDWNADGALDLVTELKTEACQHQSVFEVLWGDGRGDFSPGPKLIVPPLPRLQNEGWRPNAWVGGVGSEILIAWLPLPDAQQPITEVRTYRLQAAGLSMDCDGDGVPDECEVDCNGNGLPDVCDLATRNSWDCDGDLAPDDCEPDCDRDGTPDVCEIASGNASDCDANGIPDDCEAWDVDRNGVIDRCEIAQGDATDCDGDGIPDREQLDFRFSFQPELFHFIYPFALDDLDGDDLCDVVGWPYYYLKNHGGGVFSSKRISTPAGGSELGPLADLDGDGLFDTAEVRHRDCRRESRFFTLLNEGRGRFRQSACRFEDLDGQNRFQFAALGPGPGVDAVFLTAEGLLVLDGRGDGTFGAKRRAWDGSFPYFTSASFADLNGDHALDLATDGAYVLLQQGDGSFARGADFLPPGTEVPQGGLAVEDFDGDGDLDIVEGLLAVNRGDGSFLLDPRGQRFGSYTIAADFDHDGDVDLFSDDLLLLNDGTGSFHGPDDARMRSGYGIPGSARDLNGDDFPDIAVTGYPLGNGAIAWNKRGTLAGARYWPFTSGGLRAGDLDGDATKDLMVLPWWEKDGALWIHHAGALRFVTKPVEGIGASPVFDLPDLDGDGIAEVVVRTERGADVYQNGGEGSFRPGASIEAGGAFEEAIDVDGDRAVDLIFRNTALAEAFFLLNDGKGAFAQRRALPGVPDAIADLDGDGRPELVLDRLVYSADEQGAFTHQATLDLDPLDGVAHWAAADLNGDGLIDLTLSGWDCKGDSDSEGGVLAVLLNEGDGSYERSTWTTLGPYSYTLTPDDFDGDGDVDVFLFMTDANCRGELDEWGEFAISWNDGAGVLSGWTAVASDYLGGTREIITADLNGDGLPDFAFQHGDDVSLYLNGSHEPRLRDADGDAVPDTCSPVRFRRGDVNQDAATDIADVIATLGWLFLGTRGPACQKAADLDADGTVGVTDAVFLLRYLFLGGAAPSDPFGACGVEPAPTRLTCLRFAPCE